ncbi:MAG: hypothetical protein Aurels2KO_58490 [Aureliella sp.]
MAKLFDGFDTVFPDDDDGRSRNTPLKRRKSLRECAFFIGANIVIMPVVGLIYASVCAEGLRSLLPVFQLRLYKLPVPGAGLLRGFDGWDRLDLALLMSLLLAAVLAMTWTKVWIELLGHGSIADTKQTKPIVFCLLTSIAAIMIAGDALIFYVGLKTQAASSWAETPSYVAPAATILYSCGLALLGWWHADFKTSSLV